MERGQKMWIHLSNEAKEPLYEQIKLQIKQQIIDGTLSGDTELPSIRTLARDIKTSVITVKRAYSDLEKEGFIYTKSGRGTFVRDTHKEELNERAKHEFTKEALKLIEFGFSLGLTKEEMAKLFSEMGDD